MKNHRHLPLLLVVTLAAALPWLLWSCRAIERGADALADATAGSGVSGVFRGTARMAEGFRDYSPSEEHYIGRAVAAEILSRFKAHKDERLDEYVNLLGLAVVYSAPNARQTFSGYHFTVIEGEEPNAISAPGGFVFVTIGALRRASNEDELAAVLAHEVAHVTLQHGIGAIKSATRKRSAALLVQGAGQTAADVAREGGSQNAQAVELAGLLASGVTDITSTLLDTGYSRKQEIAADALAAEYLKASGHSRAALASYLKRLGGGGGDGGWLATHPPAEDRIKELGALAKDDSVSPKTGFAIREKRFLAARG